MPGLDGGTSLFCHVVYLALSYTYLLQFVCSIKQLMHLMGSTNGCCSWHHNIRILYVGSIYYRNFTWSCNRGLLSESVCILILLYLFHCFRMTWMSVSPDRYIHALRIMWCPNIQNLQKIGTAFVMYSVCTVRMCCACDVLHRVLNWKVWKFCSQGCIAFFFCSSVFFSVLIFKKMLPCHVYIFFFLKLCNANYLIHVAFYCTHKKILWN